MGVTPAHPVLWGIAWFALGPLWFFGLQSPPLWRAALLGFCWGVGYHGTALSWIWGLHPMTWMGIPWAASLAIAIAAWAFVTVWGAFIPTLWLVTLAALSRHRVPPLLRIWMATSLWCLLEWLWTQSPLWWTSLSYTQSPHNLAILHLGQFSGPGLVSAVLVLVNGCWAEAWIAWSRSRRGLDRMGLTQTPWVRGAMAVLILSHGLGALMLAQPLNPSAENALNIGIVQGNIPTRIKLFPAGLSQAFRDYQQGYEQLVSQGAEAVLLPEGAFPTTWNPRSPRFQSFLATVHRQGIPAWVGTFMPQGDYITQSLVTVTPENFQFSHYAKVKLVPLGEYLPWEETLGQLIGRLTPLSYRMLPGADDQQLNTPFGKAIVAICYDSAFPQLFRDQVAKGGEFILSVANNDPYSHRMMLQHHAQDVMRAIESDRWLVRATNTGYSSVINPHGKTLWRSQRNTYQTHLATLYRRQGQTLYTRWNNWFLPVQGLTSGLGWWKWHRERRPKDTG